MGLASWLAAAVCAVLLARIVPVGRSSRWALELLAAAVVALLLGGAATALDFGGWNEPAWRAALLAFLGALAAIGVLRAAAGPR
jgi:ABC-type transport system involved in cytochrome bd biosynthesis fused ATPase/permease subunit